MIFRDLSAMVGGTPMVELARVAKGRAGRVIGKLEMRNPCGSVKDRVGIALIEDAEEKGILRQEQPWWKRLAAIPGLLSRASRRFEVTG
jgi:cysteine synthase